MPAETEILRAGGHGPPSVPLRPPLWARGGQAQTLLGYFLPVGAPLLDAAAHGVTRRELDLGDGDRAVVFDAEPLEEGPLGGAVVHLFHGLTGSSESNYMRLAAEAYRRSGARVRLHNHRGQGAGEGLARGLYHSGSDGDLFRSVEDARTMPWGASALHLAVGFSLSANTLLLGLARRSDHPGAPDGALAVNPPVDLLAAVERMGRGFNRVYDRNFVRGMRASLAVRQERGWIDPDVTIPRGAGVREADERVTAPAAGYPGAEAYYRDCSSGPRLGAIRRPATILSAADDPFITRGDVESAAAGTGVQVHVEATGGHLGYLERGGRRWLAPALVHHALGLQSRSKASTSA